MASLWAGTGDVQVVDVRNEGRARTPRRRRGRGARGRRRRGGPPPAPAPLPPDMLGLVEHCKAYEHLAVEAATSGSRNAVVRALLANPLVGQYPLAEDLADALLAANRRFLPRFFPE